MPIGIPGTSAYDFNLTRNQIVEMAYGNIGVLADGETLGSDLLTKGVQKLNLIVRKIDVAGKWLWTINSTPTTLTLVANQFVYDTDDTLPTNVLELVTASYRDAQANDAPLKLLTTEGYEQIADKIQVGDPACLYLTEHKTLASRTLFVTPMLSSVNTQSVITGSDSAAWKCIRSHTADSTNKPITGANYLLFWESGGTTSGAWATGTSYTAPQHLRLWYRRPLSDFDAAGDNPDFPSQWTDHLVWKLSEALAPSHAIPLEERVYLGRMAAQSYEDIFPSVRTNTTDTQHHVDYF